TAAHAPGDRVEQDGGGDARGGGQELEHRTPLHGRVAARGADVPGRVVDDVREQLQLRDRRGERDEIGDAGGEGDLPRRLHPPACRGLPWSGRGVRGARSGGHGVLLHRSSPTGCGRSGAVDVRMPGVVVTDTSGRPRSLTLRSRPYSADWSATGPSRTVVPSAWRVRLMSSNQAAQRSARCPFTRISYRSGSRAELMLVASFAVAGPPARRR